MCYLTQFFISNITTETHAENLAKHFMKNLVLLFSMVPILFVDSHSWFKSVFKDICAALGIIYWPLARGNHKGMSIEKYHRFLKKTQAILGQDRGAHELFLKNAKTSQYAWNSAPIDGTDILKKIAAVGR